MGRVPTMPRYTCPAIDAVKSAIGEAEAHLRDAATDGEEELRYNVEQALIALQGQASAMEDLREQNDQLRTCATYWQEAAQQLERELADAQAELNFVKEQT